MPSYAVCGIGQFIRDNPCVDVRIISERCFEQEEKVKRVENVPICWIDSTNRQSINEILGIVPDILFTSGWSQKTFNRFVSEVNQKGGASYAIVDTIPGKWFKDFLRGFKIRFYLKKKFAGFFVSGKLSHALLCAAGVEPSRIYHGAYTADTQIFQSTCDLPQRPKEILFVGKFCERKNIVRILRIFKALYSSYPDWHLTCIGTGEQEAELRTLSETCAGITIKPFAEPAELARAYQTALFIILGSYTEPWGVVVHEAALSGCCLLLSDRVGAIPDLTSEKNALLFNPSSDAQIAATFKKAFQMTDEELSLAQRESLRLASSRSPKIFSNHVTQLIRLSEKEATR